MIEFDREIARLEVDDALADLADPTTVPELSADQAYWGFERAIEGAGFAVALGESEDVVRRLLDSAARLGARMYDTEPPLSRVIHAPAMVEDVFVDTSITAVPNYVRTVYAALAAGADDVVERMARVGPDDYRSAVVSASPTLEHLAGRLGAAIAGDASTAAADPPPTVHDEDDEYLMLQARAIDAITTGDAERFASLLAEFERAFAARFDPVEDVNDSDRYLELPVRGLRALAAAVELAIRVEADGSSRARRRPAVSHR